MLLKTSALVTSVEMENMLTAEMWIPSSSLDGEKSEVIAPNVLKCSRFILHLHRPALASVEREK